MKTYEDGIRDVLEYVSMRFSENHPRDVWIMPDGRKKSAFVECACMWWFECMKEELESYLKRVEDK